MSARALVAACAAASVACNDPPQVVQTSAPPPPAARSATPIERPIDHLDPDELEEGLDDAFGMKLPRALRIERRFPDTVYAAGTVKPEALARYIREHVDVDRVEIGAARTVFPTVTLRTGTNPGALYRVEVVSEPGRTLLSVRDITPHAAEPGLTEAERWRKAGISADGREADQSQGM